MEDLYHFEFLQSEYLGMRKNKIAISTWLTNREGHQRDMAKSHKCHPCFNSR